MLREYPHFRQIPGETHRRWFSSDFFDLIVWQEPGGQLKGFQLCYSRGTGDEMALTWSLKKGYSHERLDDGETGIMGFKMAPILMPDGLFRKYEIVRVFREESALLDPELSEDIIRKLEEYEQGG